MAVNDGQRNPRLKEMVLEVIENQMRDNDPPEVKQTYDRLVREGHFQGDAMRLIGRVVVSEIFGITKNKRRFNLERYVQALHNLPDPPKD